MSRDLDEFLRRAAERRAEKQGQRRVPVSNPHTTPVAKPQPAPSIARPLSQQAPVPQQASGKVQKPVAGSWGDSNRPAPATIAPAGISKDQVDHADERMSQHLRESFDHQMGNISQPATSATAGASPSAEKVEAAASPAWINELLGMLSKPSSIGSAVLLREILERPEHRW